MAPESHKVKAALIGTGKWSMQHARVLSSRPDVNLCAIVGRSHASTKARADQFGTGFYLDVDEMLDREMPDIVVVSLPNQHHFETTLKVIQAGFPLIVEKPLVFQLSEADILLREAASRNLFFAIDFNHRYARPVQMAHAAVQEGKLGDLVFASWRFGGEGHSDHPHANLIETQCHGFDSLEYLCGPIRSIMAEMTDMTGKGFTSLVLSLRFENGAVGSLIGSYDSSYAYRETHRLELNGTRGRAVIDDTVRSYSYQPTGNETAEIWEAGYFNDTDREFSQILDKHMDDILGAFSSEKDPPVHARAGRRALALAYAAIESYETGKRVTIDD